MPQKQYKKLAALELFRALAVSMVVLGHFTAVAKDLPIIIKKAGFAIASYGVPLFFIISGFLLSASLISILQKKNERMSASVKVFFIKRLLRIYPAYVVSLLILALYHQTQAIDVWLHFFNIHNLFSGFNRSINEVYWTLAVEFQWYIIAPWCIVIFVRQRMRVPVTLLLVSVGVSFFIRWSVLLAYLQRTISLNDLVILAQDQLYIHLFNFLLGVVLYRFRNVKINVHFIWVLLSVLVLFGIGYIESGLTQDLLQYRKEYLIYKVLLSYFAIIILTGIVVYFLNIEIKSGAYRIISFVSTISYSLYIYHFPILNFIGEYNLSWYFFFPAYLFSSVVVAQFSFYAVERPFLRYSAELTGK